MNKGIIWTWAAEADSQQVFNLLEDLSPGSGMHLIEAIESTLQLLKEFPFAAPVWQHPIRRAVLIKLPYALFYVVEMDRLVVTALLDTRRDPERLREELRWRLPQ